jgi:parallel beta-helix repeat protein
MGGSGGVYRSSNAGDQWQRRSSGMTWSVLTLVPSSDYHNDRTVFTGLNGGGIFRSVNSGASWEPANSGYPIGSDAVAIALSPQYEEDGTLFAGGYGTGIYRSEDRGDTWSQIGLMDVYAIEEIAMAPHVPLTEALILVGTNEKGVYRSEDGGTNWSVITQGLVISTVNEIAFWPAYTDDHTILVASDGNGLFRSRDAGVNWTQLVTGLAGSYVWALDISPDFAADGTALAETEEGLFRSQDEGDSWVELPFSDAYGVTEVAFSPHYSDDQTIWVATTQWTTESEGGVFVSEDGGDSWQQANAGLPQLEHYALATADTGGDGYHVFVGTRTWSVWQLYADFCTITSTADSGVGTLRWCLSQAEPFAYVDFDPAVFSPTMPATITLLSELPHIITDGLTIDASNAGVILDGSQLTGDEDGLHIDGADDVTIRGLQVIGFPDDGVHLANGASHAVIGGNRSVGSGSLGQGNLISGNGSMGIFLYNISNITITGNYIGTDHSGMTDLGNLDRGIMVQSSRDNWIEGNLVSGNGGNGIEIWGTTAMSNTVIGNYVGTNIYGTATISNGATGIYLGNGASWNTIGGVTDAERNLISGNDYDGIGLYNSGTSNNVIRGNYIGTNISGTAALSNTQIAGVEIWGGPTNNIIGGEADNAKNLISGNVSGEVGPQATR